MLGPLFFKFLIRTNIKSKWMINVIELLTPLVCVLKFDFLLLLESNTPNVSSSGWEEFQFKTPPRNSQLG